jgi:hypothetical protein
VPLLAGQEVMMIDVDWRQPFIDYIREQTGPADKNLAEQLICRAKSYVLVRDKLYRWGATSGVLIVCSPRRRQGHLGGDPQRRLRQSRVLTHVGQQSLLMSFLLAHSSERCRGTRQKMPRVPVLRQATTRSGLQASHHTTNLAFRLLGARHDWASSNCARRIQ